jgi:Protein of unknown function (DUF3606)
MGNGYFGGRVLAEDTAKAVPQDAGRVNVYDESEVEYWSRKFGVTPAQLLAAVEKVGDLARRVETELKRR